MLLKDISNQQLQQLESLANSLTKEEYAQELAVLSNQSLGKHIRHVLDFYLQLTLLGNTLNYDQRERNTELETDPTKAIRLIQQIKKQISTLDLNKVLLLEQNYFDQKTQIKTNLKRELLYNIEHGNHHMALIRIGIESNFPSIELSPEFGISSSTLDYLKCNH